MSSPVPLRLQVVNAFISLCRADDAWPSTLHDAGYHLAGLEIPVRGEAGVIVIDAVAQHTDRDALLAAECKSGANVHAEQARRLSELDAAALLRMVAARRPSAAPHRPSKRYSSVRGSTSAASSRGSPHARSPRLSSPSAIRRSAGMALRSPTNSSTPHSATPCRSPHRRPPT